MRRIMLVFALSALSTAATRAQAVRDIEVRHHIRKGGTFMLLNIVLDNGKNVGLMFSDMNKDGVVETLVVLEDNQIMPTRTTPFYYKRFIVSRGFTVDMGDDTCFAGFVDGAAIKDFNNRVPVIRGIFDLYARIAKIVPTTEYVWNAEHPPQSTVLQITQAEYENILKARN